MGKEYWTKSGIEPGFWETLADPIVVSLMIADRITRKDVLTATMRGTAAADAPAAAKRRSQVRATA